MMPTTTSTTTSTRNRKRARLEAVQEEENDLFAKTKQELADSVLYESSTNEIYFCRGFVLPSSFIVTWLIKDSKNNLIIQAIADNLYARHFCATNEEDRKSFEKSFGRRADFEKRAAAKGSSTAPHPVVLQFTRNHEEVGRLGELIQEVVKAFEVKQDPEFTRVNKTWIRAKFEIHTTNVLSTELVYLHSKGFTDYVMFAFKGKLYITFDLKL